MDSMHTDMLNQLIKSARLPSCQADKHTLITVTHRVSHAFPTQIRRSVYYESDSRNEHALRPPSDSIRYMSVSAERLLGQFSTSSAYQSSPSHLSLSFHLYRPFTPCLSSCLSVFAIRGVNPDWVFFFFPQHTASSPFPAVPFLLLYRLCQWMSVYVRDCQCVTELVCPAS